MISALFPVQSLIRCIPVQNQFEQENTTLKSKVQTLQSDLLTSEAVQKDFVKLSQTLQVSSSANRPFQAGKRSGHASDRSRLGFQIELEKIRQADFEVRWQHEEDVTHCGSCKRQFLSKKEKVGISAVCCFRK